MKKKKTVRPAVMSQSAQEKQWQAENDLRTLREAEAIKGSSSRTKAAKKTAQQQMKALSKITRKK